MVDKKFIDDLEYKVTGACIEVYKFLGPGLFKNIYQRCLIRELQLQKINFATEQRVQITYKGLAIDTNLRADLFIENCLVLVKIC